ncbi:MAG: phosphatase PAP2 family protein [Bacilli bacterium]|nr:phosphatase PAP2 family protein [Bacilli bacterium]
MDKKVRNWLIAFGAFFVLSIVFTILVLTVDVRASFNNPKLGLASMNEKVFNAIGESSFWYYFTQALGYLAILVVVIFAFIGVIQLIKGKSIKKVDKEIIGLGIVYIVIAIIYVFFEKVVVINYRPILEDGEVAASFPSSHTLLACVVFSTALIEAKKLINVKFIKENIIFLIEFLVILMIGGRLLSGVHWLSDIIASVLYSGVIVSGYYLAMYYLDTKTVKEE